MPIAPIDGSCFSLRGLGNVVLDRDPLYTRAFRATLADAGVNIVRLPARSPDLNAFAVRFVLSAKSECLDLVIPLGGRHLRHALEECDSHWHEERNHQGLDNGLIEPVAAKRMLARASFDVAQGST